MDFKKLQENATTAKEALASKTEETKITLEKSFVDAMTSWEDAVKGKENEAKTDTTKSAEATQARADFDKFKTDLEEELKNLLTTKENETQLNNKETQQQTNMLKDIITDQAYNLLLSYKDKTRIDIKNEQEFKTYINAFQIIITVLWASTYLWDSKDNDKNINNLWPITQAGVRTLQKYLNTTYMVWLEVDGKPGPKTLEALLSPVSDTDTTTRLEKMLADKTSGNLSLVPEKIITTHPQSKKKVEAHKTENTKKKDEKKVKEEADIPTADPDNISPELKFKQIQEQLIKKHPKLDKSLIPGWAQGIQRQESNWKIGIMKKIIKGKLYYFNQDKYLTTDYNEALQYEQKREIKTEENNTKGKEISAKQQEIINRYDLKAAYTDNKGQALCYKKAGEDWVYVIGKNNSLHKLTEWFWKDSWIVRYSYEYDWPQEWKNKQQPIWEDNINKIIIETNHNCVVYAKLIEMSTSWAGTRDPQLSLVLKNITQQKNFIQVTDAYKNLWFDLNGKDNLFNMLLEETSNANGYDAYFVKFFEWLLKNNSSYVKELILKKWQTFPEELFNNKVFVTRRKANNIEWDWINWRQESKLVKKVEQKQVGNQESLKDIVKNNNKEDKSANGDNIK